MLPFLFTMVFMKIKSVIKAGILAFSKKNYVCIKEGDKNTHHPCQCLDWEIPPGVLTFLTGEGEEQ